MLYIFSFNKKPNNVNSTISKFTLPQDVSAFVCAVAETLDTTQNNIGVAECRDLKMMMLGSLLIACHPYITIGHYVQKLLRMKSYVM
jgi:hypothetical protein